MRLIQLLFLVLISSCYTNHSQASSNLIQLALLLDTSNSMDGLIDQAKAQLWNIANEISEARYNDGDIQFELALYEYGNDNLPATENYVRLVVPFTTDMDLISKYLFELKTNGGQEYCGAVTMESLTELNWKKEAGLKVIYIAGNESFDQGQVKYAESCAKAVQKQVVLNTIFCGHHSGGIDLSWEVPALLTKGTYTNIDQNIRTVHIETPYDDQISRLNKSLNDTYISYTWEGKKNKQLQTAQDFNAETYGKSNSVNRTVYKAKKNYSNISWDAVDGYKAGKDISKYQSTLPEKYQSLTQDQLKKEIQLLSKRRDSINQEIRCLAQEREEYIRQQKKINKIKNPLEQSILRPLRSQLKKAGFNIREW